MEYYGRKFTYADLIVNVKKTAAAFRAVGVKKGDIITVVSVMTPEVIFAFYAADSIGVTLNLVDPATASKASTSTSRGGFPPAALPECE